MTTTFEKSAQNGHAPQAENAPPKLHPRAESPLERIERVKAYLYDGTLIKGEDYGVIPGTQGSKPSLLKPGAQKLCGLFQLAPIVKHVERAFKPDFIAYEVTYQVTHKVTGIVEGEGVGACNSKERKYKNKDAYDVANTLLKMAGKRALVDATLNALGISSLFTQDIEDFAPEVQKQAEPSPINKTQIATISGCAKKFYGAETWKDNLSAYLSENYEKTLAELSFPEAEAIKAMFSEELAKVSAPESAAQGEVVEGEVVAESGYFDEEDEPAEEDAAPDSNALTDAQHRAILALGRRVFGPENRDEQIARRLQKPIESLTKAEATAFIEELRAMVTPEASE